MSESLKSVGAITLFVEDPQRSKETSSIGSSFSAMNRRAGTLGGMKSALPTEVLPAANGGEPLLECGLLLRVSGSGVT